MAVKIVGPVRRSRGIAHRRQTADAATVRGVVLVVGEADEAAVGPCDPGQAVQCVVGVAGELVLGVAAGLEVAHFVHAIQSLVGDRGSRCR